MVSTSPLISKLSSPYTKLLMTVPSAPITTDITVTFVFHSFFSSLARSRYLSFFLLSFCYTLWSAGTAKSIIRQVIFLFFFFFFFFFFGYHKVWSFGRDEVICLYLKIPEKFVSFFFEDGFRVVHITFVRFVKFKLLAQFPVDHFAHPVVSGFFFYCFYANLLHSLKWLITLVYKNKFLVWGKNVDRCFLLIWVCFI